MKIKRTTMLMNFFKERHGVATFSEIRDAGFAPSLKALRGEGKIEKTDRGLYRVSGGENLSNPDLVTVSLRAPHGIVCLISALSFHHTTDQIPHEIDLAIPKGAWESRIDQPPVHYYHFSKKVYEAGIEEHKIDGRIVRVYSLAKTIADCFKFRYKIGENIGLDALKQAVADRRVSVHELMHYAQICRSEKAMKPYLRALQ